MIKLYKTILPMVAILSLVTPILLILSLAGRSNPSYLLGLVGVIDINPTSETFTLIILGISLLGLSSIIRKKLNL